MPRRKYSTRIGDYVDLTPEEEAARDADEAQAVVRKAARDAEKARLSEIKANELVTTWEDRIRGKTFAEINTAFNNTTSAQKNDLLKALLMRWAMEVKS